MHILAATDFSTRSQRALRRAGLLARESDAELTLVHIVEDDQPPKLVELERREAERTLEEQIRSMVELRGVRSRPLVVPGYAFDGILRTAQLVKADFVVMGAHRKQSLRDVFVGTTIERVVRTGSYPVLMVNNEAKRPYGRVLAAVEASEPSAHAIRTVQTLGWIRDHGLTLLHAFTPFAQKKIFDAVSIETADRYLSEERLRVTAELTMFLETNGLLSPAWPQRVEEGAPLEVISRVVEETNPDLLVMGTHSRTGIAKLLLGSVTDEVMRSVDVDILAVPPMRAHGADVSV